MMIRYMMSFALEISETRRRYISLRWLTGIRFGGVHFSAKTKLDRTLASSISESNFSAWKTFAIVVV